MSILYVNALTPPKKIGPLLTEKVKRWGFDCTKYFVSQRWRNTQAYQGKQQKLIKPAWFLIWSISIACLRTLPSLPPADLSSCLSFVSGERCQSFNLFVRTQLRTGHCCRGGCLVIYVSECVLGGACQMQSQLSATSKMADMRTAVTARMKCPPTDASAALMLRSPSLLFFAVCLFVLTGRH